MPLEDVQLLLEGYDSNQRIAPSLSHVESIFVSLLPPNYARDSVCVWTQNWQGMIDQKRTSSFGEMTITKTLAFNR